MPQKPEFLHNFITYPLILKYELKKSHINTTKTCKLKTTIELWLGIRVVKLSVLVGSHFSTFLFGQ